MRRRLLAALLLLWSQVADAATYYYNMDTGNNGNPGTALLPRKTIAHANLQDAGSVIILQASTTPYDTKISPIYGNTTWIGPDTTRSARPGVKVPGFYLKVSEGSQGGYTGHIDNTVVNGIYFTEGVHIEASPPYGWCDGTHIRNSTIEGHFYASEANVRVERDTIGTGKNGSHFRMSGDVKVNQATLIDNVMNLRPGQLTNETFYLFQINGEHPADHPRQYDVLRNNKITMTYPKGYVTEKLMILRGMQYSRLTNNKWHFRDSSDTPIGGATAQGFLERDCFRYNKTIGDTIIFETQIPGTGGLKAQMVGPGSTDQGFDNTCYQNTWSFMYLRSNEPVTTGCFAALWQLGNGDSLYQNVMACSTGVNNSGFFIHNAVGTSYVERNTFFNADTGGAVRMGTTLPEANSPCSAWTGTVNFRGNICYSRSTGTGANDYAAAMFWQSGGVGIDADYNLYAHYGGGGSRAIYGGTCGSGGLLYGVGPLSALCSTIGNDCNSLVGRPLFADSTWANFNPALTAGSAALGGYLGANIGAWDGTPAGTDVTAPAAIADLASTGVGADVATFSWLAPGDDGGSGTAASYTIRYSSTAPTAATFASGTLVANVNSPQAAGTREYLVVSGLSPSTDYYFAITTADSDGNVSPLSNVIRITTLPASGLDRFSE